MRPPLEGGTVLLTGASSGIGRAMALELGPIAGTLVLVARRAQRLEELKEELLRTSPKLKVHVLPCDLNDLEAIEALLETLASEVGEVDVLINNAGLGDIGFFEFSSWDKLRTMIQVNVLALTYLTHRLLEPMIKRSRGGILNISSGFGLSLLPGAAAYAGSKHYVTAFTETLRMELRGTGIVVSQVCPGPVKTEFESVAGNPTGHEVPGLINMSADKCARLSLKGFRRGKAIIIPGFFMRFAAWANAMSPRFVIRLVFIPISNYLRRRQVRYLASAGKAPS